MRLSLVVRGTTSWLCCSAQRSTTCEERGWGDGGAGGQAAVLRRRRTGERGTKVGYCSPLAAQHMPASAQPSFLRVPQQPPHSGAAPPPSPAPPSPTQPTPSHSTPLQAHPSPPSRPVHPHPPPGPASSSCAQRSPRWWGAAARGCGPRTAPATAPPAWSNPGRRCRAGGSRPAPRRPGAGGRCWTAGRGEGQGRERRQRGGWDSRRGGCCRTEGRGRGQGRSGGRGVGQAGVG